MFNKPTTALSAWQIFSTNFTLLKHSYVKALPFTLILGVLSVLSTLLQSAALASADNATLLRAISFVVGIVMWFIIASIIILMKKSIDNEPINHLTIFSQHIYRAIMGGLSYIVFSVVFAFSLIVVLLLEPTSRVMAYSLAALILLFLIYLSVRLIAWLPFIIDGSNPVKAFKASFALTKGHWWHTFFTGFFIMLLSSIVEYIVLTLSVMISAGVNSVVPSIGSIIISILGLTLLPVWLWGGFWLVIKDLQTRH